MSRDWEMKTAIFFNLWYFQVSIIFDPDSKHHFLSTILLKKREKNDPCRYFLNSAMTFQAITFMHNRSFQLRSTKNQSSTYQWSSGKYLFYFFSTHSIILHTIECHCLLLLMANACSIKIRLFNLILDCSVLRMLK